MIPPQSQWCHQICVTSACWPKPACSNCTRMLGHEKKRYFMSVDQFETAIHVAKSFLVDSAEDRGMRVNRNNPGLESRRKVLGIFGGEPLMHPEFPTLVDIMVENIPKRNRGLWTSFDWANGKSPKYGAYRPHVDRLLGKQPTGSTRSDQEDGYLNWNMHEEHQVCEHSPVLVAANDLIPDEKKRWDTISKCWVQTEWSAAYALDHNEELKFYFCEVAASFDRVLGLGTGLPVEPGVWRHPLWFERDHHGVLQPFGPYADQIRRTCGRCGASMRLPGRRDREFTDDISPSNLVTLQEIGSPMVRKGQYQERTAESYESTSGDEGRPWEYLKDQGQVQAENFGKATGDSEWIKYTYLPDDPSDD